MASLGPVVVRNTFKAPRSLVWSYIVDESLRSKWWRDLSLETVAGGKISEKWSAKDGAETLERDASGTVSIAVPAETLSFRWRDNLEDNETSVVVMLRPDDEDFAHTVVTVIESGFAGHPHAAELVDAATNAWHDLFENLSGVLAESGAYEAPTAAQTEEVSEEEELLPEQNTEQAETDEEQPAEPVENEPEPEDEIVIDTSGIATVEEKDLTAVEITIDDKTGEVQIIDTPKEAPEEETDSSDMESVEDSEEDPDEGEFYSAPADGTPLVLPTPHEIVISEDGVVEGEIDDGDDEWERLLKGENVED